MICYGKQRQGVSFRILILNSISALLVSLWISASAKVLASDVGVYSQNTPISYIIDNRLPEPENWEMLIVGLVMVGIKVRYRHTSTTEDRI